VSDRDLFDDRRPGDRFEDGEADAPFEDGLDADELAEQRAVRALLASLPDPGPVPPDVLDRITSTLRSLQEEQQADVRQRAALYPVAGGATIARPRHRPAGRALWLAAAAAVVLAGGGAVMSRLADDTSPRDSAATASAGASESAAARSATDERGTTQGDLLAPVYASGTRYRSADLVRQAQDLLDRRRLAGGPADSDAAALPRRRAVAGCLQAVGPTGSTLRAADLATYEGRPAVVLVLATSRGLEVRVTARTCPPGTAALRTAQLP
jgi:hypothetical protein